MSQGGLYNEGAGAPPGPFGGDQRLAGDDSFRVCTEAGCRDKTIEELFGGNVLVLPAVGDLARGIQVAWTWAFGSATAPSYSTLQAAVGSLERAKVVQAVVRGEGSLSSLSAVERQAAAQFYRQAATFFELRGANAGRVIIHQRSANSFTIVGKFQGHVRGDAAGGSAQTAGPPPGTCPADLAAIGHRLADYARAAPADRAKIEKDLLERAARLEQRLKKSRNEKSGSSSGATACP